MHSIWRMWGKDSQQSDSFEGSWKICTISKCRLLEKRHSQSVGFSGFALSKCRLFEICALKVKALWGCAESKVGLGPSLPSPPWLSWALPGPRRVARNTYRASSSCSLRPATTQPPTCPLPTVTFMSVSIRWSPTYQQLPVILALSMYHRPTCSQTLRVHRWPTCPTVTFTGGTLC